MLQRNADDAWAMQIVGNNTAQLVKVQAGPSTHACSLSLGFFRVMQSAMQYAHQHFGGRLRFCLYHDGVTPGNNLRPDCGRSFVSFLWTWLDLPLWMRSREILRWITCSYVGKKMMKKHKFTVMPWRSGLNLKQWGFYKCWLHKMSLHTYTNNRHTCT